MASQNSPNRITLDAYSDPMLETYAPNGVYSQFTNRLQVPILGAKSFELISATFVNNCLQLNDQSQLMFFYYRNASATAIATLANLRCVRLLPSSYVPPASYALFTQNKYFNTVTELTAALTTASAANGDDITYNPLYSSGDLTFSYDTTTRRISVTSNSGSVYIAPAAADDPNVLDTLRGTTTATNRIKMKGYNATSYATGTFQPYVEGISMNARLGFAMAYGSRGLYWGTSAQTGCATSIGVPLAATAIVADANPILLGAQSVGIYLDTVMGGGFDSARATNLLAPVFIDVPPLNVMSYVPASVNQALISVPQEIYQITVTLVDDAGVPFVQSPNYNVRVEISIGY